MRKLFIIAAAASFMMSGCLATRVAGAVITAPVKLTAKTVQLTGKGVIGTTKLAGKALVGTGKVTGKTVVGTGKIAGKAVAGTGRGLYYIGTTPVHIANGALDTTSKVLRVTTQMVDLTGEVVKVSRDVQAFQLENELLKYRGMKNLLDIVVDVVR